MVRSSQTMFEPLYRGTVTARIHCLSPADAPCQKAESIPKMVRLILVQKFIKFARYSLSEHRKVIEAVIRADARIQHYADVASRRRQA